MKKENARKWFKNGFDGSHPSQHDPTKHWTIDQLFEFTWMHDKKKSRDARSRERMIEMFKRCEKCGKPLQDGNVSFSFSIIRGLKRRDFCSKECLEKGILKEEKSD